MTSNRKKPVVKKQRSATRVGDVGFPMVVHPRDADTAWVFPMDGTMVWPRTSPDGKPAVYTTGGAYNVAPRHPSHTQCIDGLSIYQVRRTPTSIRHDSDCAARRPPFGRPHILRFQGKQSFQPSSLH